MEIKSNYTNKDDVSFFTKILMVVDRNMTAIVITVILLFVIHSISTADPAPKPTVYDCSSLSKEKQTLLTTTINSRLALIKVSLNKGLNAGSAERSDTQETIEKIMFDTRKEFCVPIIETIDLSKK